MQLSAGSGVVTVEALARVDLTDVGKARWITNTFDDDVFALAELKRYRDRALA